MNEGVQADIYQCWGRHREDLTAQVASALENRFGTIGTVLAEPAVFAVRHGDRQRQIEVKVACSEGHENVFYVTV